MGDVVQLRRPPQTRALSIWWVQPFWLDRGRPGAGRVREFGTRREADVAARVMGERYWRVEVSLVRGYPGTDTWEPPEAVYAIEERSIRRWRARERLG